jgi:hypothetical protein
MWAEEGYDHYLNFGEDLYAVQACGAIESDAALSLHPCSDQEGRFAPLRRTRWRASSCMSQATTLHRMAVRRKGHIH